MFPPRIPQGRTGKSRGRLLQFVITAFLLLLAARWLASFAIEYQWWSELGQLQTWFDLYLYGFAPVAAATLIAAAALWTAHSLGLRFAETRLREHRTYRLITGVALLVLAFLIASATLDTWTVVRYAGSRGLGAITGAFHDAVFGKPLSFYLFDLPFYQDLRRYLLALAIASIAVYWLSARAWQLRYRMPAMRDMQQFDIGMLRLTGGMESRFLRGALAVVLLAFAAKFFLGRYEMVYNDHGFMTGIDYVDATVALPLQWLLVAAALGAAAFAAWGRWLLLGIMVLAIPIDFIVPKLVSSLYVKPNEISIERPYINTHIHSTRSAYGLEQHVTEIEFKTHQVSSIDTVKHKPLLDNVRLWDWRPFHDTVTQQQALRTYYVFNDTDVDRYTIDGQYRQVLLTARELDIRQLPDARASWINPHFIYTHGYGLALAEVSKITPEGRPVYLVENMPPEIKTPSLKIAYPEIYYGEVMHEPVFVRTAQEEFNYPSGNDNVKSRYNGKGGFPVSSLPMRIAAAVHEGDMNILLTQYLTPESRMMIRRKVLTRVEELAGFLSWDGDPYLTITPEGRLVWMIDGYTTSDAHPYSRSLDLERFGRINYIRNSVKATVDAYDGETKLYVFDPSDPIVRAYQNLFPHLFHPRSEMPAGLQAHTRYPEILFNVQAEIYRTYHMTNPQAFYNKEDLWDLAQYVSGQNGQPQPVTPTYVVANLPGEEKPEFLLMTSFTPRTKQNLIGVMAARCDGEHLGELTVMELSKQELTPGPMQIAASINQDQNISKDLTLWNQQGSTVLRGQMLVLPVDNTFLYVEPIYLQATEARMPQLKKVVLGVGNRLIYTDTYEQALAQLGRGGVGGGAFSILSDAAQGPTAVPGGGAPGSSPQITSGVVDSIRRHLQRYRELQGQWKWSDAGRELEAIEAEVKK
ncbi:MAG: UPF0182 family protein [Acidobacteriota bacterium]|nr:UPF0182 family protein [Acidobacteriota bacterium]